MAGRPPVRPMRFAVVVSIASVRLRKPMLRTRNFSTVSINCFIDRAPRHCKDATRQPRYHRRGGRRSSGCFARDAVPIPPRRAECELFPVTAENGFVRTSCDLLAKPVQKDERKLVGSAGSDYLFLSRGAGFIRGMLVRGKNGKERA